MEIIVILILINMLVWGCILGSDPIEKSLVGYVFSFCIGLVIGIIVIPGYFMMVFACIIKTVVFIRNNVS